MKKLSESIATIALELHPERINAISNTLLKEASASPTLVLKEILGSSFPQALVGQFSKALESSPGVTNRELAAMFQASSATATLIESSSSIELVWTGPSNGIVPIRHTAQVLKGLIDEAKDRLFLVSFVAYNIVTIVEALQRARQRGVQVSILLEQSREHGGTLDRDSIELMRKSLPSVQLYEWDKSQASGFSPGCVHAKCAVADGAIAFVTSANLTDAAMERNMELGVLTRGGGVPSQLDQHLTSLVLTKHLKAI